MNVRTVPVGRGSTLMVTEPSTHYLTVDGFDGKAIVRIGSDGTIELDPSMTATEQAKAFWDALRKIMVSA